MAAHKHGLSIFMVYQLNSPLSNAVAGINIQGNASSGVFIAGKTSTTGAFSVGNSQNDYTPSNQKEIGSGIFTPNNPTGNTLFINGVLQAQVASTGVSANTSIISFHIESRGVGPNGSIDIYELIVYSSPLITSERQQVENYLGIKYGVTVVLPLQLVSFNGNLQQNKVVLNWKTANESGTALFEVERSINGITFVKTGSKKAGENSYSFTDENSGQSKELYYRLKMIDTDGRFTYSNVLRLSNNTKAQLTVFPNPATGMITLNGITREGYISIINADGKKVLIQKVKNQSEKVNISALEKGIYIFKYFNAEQVFEQKIIKQ